jgi:hypothetical protein
VFEDEDRPIEAIFAKFHKGRSFHHPIKSIFQTFILRFGIFFWKNITLQNLIVTRVKRLFFMFTRLDFGILLVIGIFLLVNELPMILKFEMLRFTISGR